MALTSHQRRKAKEKLAAQRGVSVDSITDSAVQAAINAGVITSTDYGTSSSFDCGAHAAAIHASISHCF